jgi:3-oxoadipate enol-lactonase
LTGGYEVKIKANGINMSYEIYGEGPVLVLIHGAGDNLNMWYHQVPVFSKTYRVITYDVRGSGNTDSPEGDYSLSLFADDIYALMVALGVAEVRFLGYSMGGRIALELAVNHPEMVKGLVFANSPLVAMGPPPPSGNEQRRRPIPNMMMSPEGDMKAFAENMATTAFSPGFRDRNPAEFQRYVNVKLLNQPQGIGRLMRSLGGLGRLPDYGKLKCPVLIIVGEHDALTGVEMGTRANKAIPGSELAILPSGHAAAIEAPEQFNAVVMKFLAKT